VGAAPPKGCASYNGQKLPFLFLFYSFLTKLRSLVRTLPLGASASNFDAKFHELQEITMRPLSEIDSEEGST